MHDLSCSKSRNLLTKATGLINALVLASGSTSNSIALLSIADRDALFEIAFVSLCKTVYNISDDSTLDKRRFGERSYTTLYDRVNKLVRTSGDV